MHHHHKATAAILSGSWFGCKSHLPSRYSCRDPHGDFNPRHRNEFMMTSSDGNISAILDICAGNLPVTGEFPAQSPVTLSFDDGFFDLRPNKRLSKHWPGWWFEKPSRPFWRRCNVCWTTFTNREYLRLRHGCVITSIVFCGMKLLIHALTSAAI